MMPRRTVCRLAIAFALIALALSGCGEANRIRSVSELVRSGRSQHAIETGGAFATEPTRTAEGTSFTLVEPGRPSRSVNVLYAHSLPPLDDHGPDHYSGRRVIVRGDFDGRRLIASEVVVQRLAPYEAP